MALFDENIEDDCQFSAQSVPALCAVCEPKQNFSDTINENVVSAFESVLNDAISLLYVRERFKGRTLCLDATLFSQLIFPFFPDFLNALCKAPTTILGSLSAAFIRCFPQLFFLSPADLELVFVNLRPLSSISILKSANVGELVSFKGIVSKVGAVSSIVTSMTFVCKKCGERKEIKAVGFDGCSDLGHPCPTPSCKNRRMLLSVASICYNDTQWIEIEENGRSCMMGKLRIRLPAHLLQRLSVGEDHIFTGIFSVWANKKTQDGVFEKWLDCTAVEGKSEELNTKFSQNSKIHCKTFEQCQLQMIASIALYLDFDFLVFSFCPSIQGEFLAKAVLLLSLASSCIEKHSCCTSINRLNSHVMLLGDAGIGKSQLLSFAAQLIEKTVSVCGNSASGKGLAASVTTNEHGGPCLDAGALALADGGICFIDEFDKLNASKDVLLEVMEQQKVSVAKAGIVCSLPAKSTVIAAANPVKGYYMTSKPLSQNLAVSQALLSRFDIVLVMKNNIQAKSRIDAANSILSRHNNDRKTIRPSKGASVAPLENNSSEIESTLARECGRFSSCGQTPLAISMMRTYLRYGHSFCFPKLSTGAKVEFKNYYLRTIEETKQNKLNQFTLQHLAEKQTGQTSVRNLESCIRLGIAKARLSLREEVTQQDAEWVVELLNAVDQRHQVLTAEPTNEWTGDKKLSRNKACKLFIEHLHKTYGGLDSKVRVSLKELRDEASTLGLLHRTPSFEIIIDTLNERNVLLKRANGFYEIIG